MNIDIRQLNIWAMGTFMALCAGDASDQFPSVSGRYSFYAKGWNARVHRGGPLSQKTTCDGYASRGESEIYWEYVGGLSLAEAEKRICEHQLPLWIGLPSWDQGRIEKIHASKNVSSHLIVHRTNGRIPELLYLFEEGDGVLCIHVLKPDWSKLDLASIAMDIYQNAHGKVLPAGKALNQDLEKCAFKPRSVPANFEDAINALECLMTPTELEKLKNLDGIYGLVEAPLPVGEVPTGGILWGPEIGGRWGLVDGGSPLSRELDSAGVHDVEDQEAAILLGLQRKLLGKKYCLKTVIQELLHPK